MTMYTILMTNDTIYLAGGCFWGVQELIRVQPGVLQTKVGYAGGKNEHPTYEFHPGHAEAVEIIYDNSATSKQRLWEYFFRIHDPTTCNQQGNDIGSSYRSTLFYRSDEEKDQAEAFLQQLTDAKVWKNEIVTTVEPLGTFWPAEEYHQDYLQKNPNGYTCHYERSNTPVLPT